jgi:hypothetical protein
MLRRFSTRLICAMWLMAFSLLIFNTSHLNAAARKGHTVVLGAQRRVAYTKAGDPAGAAPNDTELRIRALLVDGALKEWTTGDPHDVTDRSFVVRRALRINDALPEVAPVAAPPDTKPTDAKAATHAPEKPAEAKPHWVWQRGPWLLVDRSTGHITALKLPDYDPGVSQPVWFRDYAAYCGVTASGKSLYAVVAQLAARKPVLSKKLSEWERENPVTPACAAAEWQRDPLRVIFHPTGHDAASFALAPGSAVLVEDAGDEAEPAQTSPAKVAPPKQP